MKKRGKIIIFFVLILLLSLIFIRLISPKEIDDVNPRIPCEKNYLEKSNILWVVPKYENAAISENKTWCEEIKLLNKTIGMHGIYHSYHEFSYYVNESELLEAKKIFENCFGYSPTLFKPPYLRLTEKNKEILEKNNLTVKQYWNQNIHKVYHCKNTGIFPNWFHDII